MGDAWWWVLVPVGGRAGLAFWATTEEAVAAATAGPGQVSLFFWEEEYADAGRWREYRFPWYQPPPNYDPSHGIPGHDMATVSGHYPPVY